jgi:hypothetical protein
MIVAAFAGLSLIVTVAVDPRLQPRPGGGLPEVALSAQQKSVAIRPLMQSATECVARSVNADPRFGESSKSGNVNELIVELMPGCADAMRAMIDAYDRYYGEGSGETFFMGPYLEVLPTAVKNLINRGL